MKTYTAFTFAALTAAHLLHASGQKPACCAADSAPAQAGDTAASTLAPFSPRSLYHLDATWTNDAGEKIALASWRGRPVVIAMIFAQCEYACPVLVNDLRRIEQQLPAAVRARTAFVLVTFDVKRDTVAALRAYRARMELPTETWSLLRGNESDVQDLAMLLGVKYKQDARGQFAHSNLITVLDAGGQIVHQHAGLDRDISEAAKAVVQTSGQGR